jgi:ABC-2 type transport system permease protein
MRIQARYIALKTILIKETLRFIRIWMQTILPPVITTALYFIIFGNLIGPQIGAIQGYSYSQYIAPGLIMMAIITNAYSNVVSSFFSSKFQRHVEELIVAPIPNSLILIGFMAGGIARGLAVGVAVTAITLFFTHIHIHDYFVTAAVVLLTAALFSQAGFINGIYAKSFDDISIIPTFVLTPLTYLGGVFYSIDMLAPFWQDLSRINPILYMVNAFRYGILGLSDVNIHYAFALIVLLNLILFAFGLWLLDKGVGVKQ